MVVLDRRSSRAYDEPGVWWHAVLDGKPSAIVTCPSCGGHGGLHDHSVDDEGNVTPSLVCPHGSCTFHDFVRLDGWQSRLN